MNKPSPTKISVIVTTYNWPNALRAVLDALSAQKTTHPFEIIVADNGSRTETAKIIRDIKSRVSIPILHIWHPNEGTSAAAIKNKAVLAALGDYIVFLDGHCIPRSGFILHHLKLAETKKFVVGNHILLNRAFTITALSEMLPLYRWSLWRWCVARLKGQCKNVKGYNLGTWKSDLLNINGLEENLTRLQNEDADLIIRLLRSGVKQKNSLFTMPAIQLWSPEKDTSQKRNKRPWLKAKTTHIQVNAEKGLNQYAI